VPDPVPDSGQAPGPGGGLRFTPAGDLDLDTVYTATVVGAWDEHGNGMAVPYTWRFATQSTTPFVVEGVEPGAGLVGVPLTATVAISFNKGLLAGSEGLVTFRVERLGDSMGQAYVPGQVTLQGATLRFTPEAPLEPGVVYQARVAGATSFLGERQTTPHRWAFETLAAAPPGVTRSEPQSGATGVPRDTAITVFFDQALHVGGEEVEFRVEDPQGRPLAGHLTWVWCGEDDVAVLGRYTEGTYLGYRGLRFRPLAPLAEGTTYDVTVKGVENLAGAPMAEPYLWSFMTSGSMIFTTPTPVVRRYYAFNSQRVALRETGLDGQDVLYWLAGDHLGTTSLVLNEAGDTIVAESRHYPYGEERWSSGTLPTDYRFTGQRIDSYINVYHMGARWYDSALGRWLSADTIVPDFMNPQSLNRFSWVLDNPLVYTDSSGHMPWWLRYGIWQAGMTYYSGYGRVPHPLLHGRNDAAANTASIKRSAPRHLELMVAASIAHQASDPKDRPYGTDVIDVGKSQGIAQLQLSEIETWAPSLAGGSRHDPEVAISVMTGKLQYAEFAILGAQKEGGIISKTDRYMLLALAQNCAKARQIQDTIATFLGAGRDWDQAFDDPLAKRNDWKEQLRLMVLHIDWLLLNGWELPEGVDLYYIREKAFED
jgi:RHS repeat-associated protein